MKVWYTQSDVIDIESPHYLINEEGYVSTLSLHQFYTNPSLLLNNIYDHILSFSVDPK